MTGWSGTGAEEEACLLLSEIPSCPLVTTRWIGHEESDKREEALVGAFKQQRMTDNSPSGSITATKLVYVQVSRTSCQGNWPTGLRSQERAGIQVVVSMDKDEKCWFPWSLDGDGVLVVIGIVEIPVRGTGDHLLPTYEVTMV